VGERKGWGRIAVTVAGGLLATGMLARLAQHTDARAAWADASRAGPLVFAALGPFAVGMAIDAWGLAVLLRGLGHRVTLAQVLPVRLASEALHVSVPAGFVASDTATAVLLQSRCGVPVRDGVVASIARKWLVMRSHAVYIALGAIAGFPALLALSRALAGNGALPWIVLSSAAVPLALSAGVSAGLLGRSTFSRLHGALARIPSRRVARWLEARRHEAVTTDAQVRRLRGARASTALASLAFFGCWCVEALESALLLRLVGADVSLPAVFAIEAGLSLVRSAVVVLPSGLGPVDLGYATVLPLLGADAGAAPAFVLLKRAKEVVWVLVGYGLLSARSRRERPAWSARQGHESITVSPATPPPATLRP